MKVFFNTAGGLKIDIEGVIKEIVYFMKKNPKCLYKIIVGTDSELTTDKKADFVSAIVVHRVGNGGRYFYRRLEYDKIYTLRDRIIQEVLISLEIARDLLIELKKENLPATWNFEIHADIGENGETKTLIQEVVGIIRANNFEAKTKPESYVATKVADRYV